MQPSKIPGGILTLGNGKDGLISGWLMCSHQLLLSPLTSPQQSPGPLTLFTSRVTAGTELLMRRCRFDCSQSLAQARACSQSLAQARALWWLLGPCVDIAAQEWWDLKEPWEWLGVIITPLQCCQTSSQCRQHWGKKLWENSSSRCRGLQRHCCSP